MGLLKEQPLSLTTVFTVTSRPLSLGLCNPRIRARPSLSLIFLGLPFWRETVSTCERWLLVQSYIRATDNFEISHIRAISRSDSPVFSLRIQTLARCSAEIFPVYTITHCQTVCSCNRLTVNPVYSLKYCTRDYATIVVFRLRRKVRYKTPDIFQTCTTYDNSREKPQKTYFSCSNTVKTAFLGRATNSDNHGQKSWDSYTVRTLLNTRETVSACY